MSTLFEHASLECGPAAPGPFAGHFSANFGHIQNLLQWKTVAARLVILDQLDAMICALERETRAASSQCRFLDQAYGLRSQLERYNEELFMAARAEIARWGTSPALHQWIFPQVGDQSHRVPQPGLGFDVNDDILDGILKLRDPGDASPPQAEMLPYQPTPARHIVDLISAAKLSARDVLVDLGSGLGRVPLLASVLTGCQTLGVELEPSYVARAEECARSLNLTAVQFVTGDARFADLSRGTVFHLFSPFTGSILDDVLARLRKASQRRQIRICSLGPCTHALRHEGWLKAGTQPCTERITVFESR